MPSSYAAPPAEVYQAALALCVERRAMLIVDPDPTWGSSIDREIQSAIDGRNDLGLSGPAARNAALYFPCVRMVGRTRHCPTPKIERKRVYLAVSAPWLETFEAEVASFPMSKYADQVESMVQFLYLLDHRNRWTIDLSAVVEHREQPF